MKAHGFVKNPAREVTKLRERYDPNHYDFFSPEETQALADGAASPQDRAIFLTAAFTGLQMGELIALRWGDVDFDTEALHVYGSYSLVTLTAPKSGPQPDGADGRAGALRTGRPPAARAARPRRPGVPRRARRVSRRLRAAPPLQEGAGARRTAAAPLPRPAPHLGSIAINQATIVQVQAWMGHADIDTTMKYMHHRSRAGDARLLSAAFRGKKRKGAKRAAPASAHG